MSEFRRRLTERQSPCPGCHPDRPDLRCVIPDGHVVHWDGQREIWLSSTVADDLAIAAADRAGYERAVAIVRRALEAARAESRIRPSQVHGIRSERNGRIAALGMLLNELEAMKETDR